jgi:Sulfotransferase family
MNPYVFVVGCPRSGTTLLRRMLDAHPKLAITPETHWIPRLFEKRDGLTPAGDVTPEFVSSLLGSNRFQTLRISPEQVWELFEAEQPIAYPRFVAGIYDLFGARRGKPVVGDKTPGYTRAIRTLHELFPAARFVHLVRDGRDVCLSATTWHRVRNLERRFSSWREHPVLTAALWWEWHVRLAREAGAQLGAGLYCELRYEALVAAPARELEALSTFLDLDFSEAMLGFHVGRTKTDRDLGSNKRWLPPTPGLRDWRSQMPAEDVERFEAVAGDLLDELGYARGAVSVSDEKRALAERLRRVFADDARSRRGTVPAAWERVTA